MLFSYFRNHPVVILLPLLVGQLALLSLQIKDAEGVTLLRRSVLIVVSPFLLATHVAGSFVGRVWDDYAAVREARNENEELKRQVGELTLQAQQNSTLALKARQLQELLDLHQRLPFKSRAASVIGRTPSFLSFSLILDRGSADGITKDAPVITVEGVVGRVVNVLPRTSEVQTLPDSDAAAGALVARTRVQCVLNGRGTALLKLSYLLNQEDVQPGDMVLTSGLDSIYPRDLILGQVVRVGPGETVFKDIDVLPTVNFSRIEEVLVLLDASPKP